MCTLAASACQFILVPLRSSEAFNSFLTDTSLSARMWDFKVLSPACCGVDSESAFMAAVEGLCRLRSLDHIVGVLERELIYQRSHLTTEPSKQSILPLSASVVVVVDDLKQDHSCFDSDDVVLASTTTTTTTSPLKPSFMDEACCDDLETSCVSQMPEPCFARTSLSSRFRRVEDWCVDESSNNVMDSPYHLVGGRCFLQSYCCFQ
jgi:hypothetical protein